MPIEHSSDYDAKEEAALAALNETLIHYPCRFPIKVMVENDPKLVHEITKIALQFDSTFDESSTELRKSPKGNYLGLTIYIYAVSRVQLDNLYRALTGHQCVKYVL
jgi:uncharacterized protein